MDFPRLVLTRWDHGSPDLSPLKVYGPNPLHMMLDRFFGENGVIAQDINARTESSASQAVFEVRGGVGDRPGPRFDPQEVSPGDVIEGKGWKIKVGPTRHVHPTLNCLSYRSETDEGPIAYSRDN
jgi:hypothetical protein